MYNATYRNDCYRNEGNSTIQYPAHRFVSFRLMQCGEKVSDRFAKRFLGSGAWLCAWRSQDLFCSYLINDLFLE